MTYSLKQFGQMIGPENHVRVMAFEEALRRTVTKDTVVLDIGTGTGHFALVAAKLGAAHVYAIETNPLMALAEKLASENGFDDRITFIRGLSTSVELPQKADIVISDLGGAIPLANLNVLSLADARDRFLAPRGRMIPEQVSLFAGVVSVPKLYEQIVAPWKRTEWNLDLSSALTQAVNTPQACQLSDNHLLSDSAQWGEMDYRTIRNTDAHAELSLSVIREGTAHGIALWVDYHIVGDIRISSAPDKPALPIYGQHLLPFTRPVEVEPGDCVNVTLKAYGRNGSYVWGWRTAVTNQAGTLKACFRQANLPPPFPVS